MYVQRGFRVYSSTKLSVYYMIPKFIQFFCFYFFLNQYRKCNTLIINPFIVFIHICCLLFIHRLESSPKRFPRRRFCVDYQSGEWKIFSVLDTVFR